MHSKCPNNGPADYWSLTLVSKCATRAVLPDTLSILSPLQVGVGLSGGCDAVLHSILSVIHDTNIPSENKFTLLVDFSNAFNSIDRAALFKEVRYRLQQIAAWTECSYGSQPILLLDDCPIYSCCEVQQGDPLGPLGFALVLQPVIENIKEEVPSFLINVWHLNDGTLCGTEEELAIALSIIETEGSSHGLFLNREISLIYTPMNSSIIHPKLHDIPSTSVGFSLLGSPIGPSGFCEETVTRQIHNVQEMVARLRDLENSQLETILLRSCLALPKVSRALRTCPPCLIPKALDAFDDLLTGALSDLAGSPVPNWSWLKASLACSLGGLNIRSASRHASTAYIGSLHQCQALVTKIRGKFAPSPTLLAISFQSLSRVPVQEINVCLQQHSLSCKIDEATFDFLLTSASQPCQKALLLSTSIHRDGDWLNVVPLSALGLHLQDQEFHLCLKYWLGLQMFEEQQKYPVCLTPDKFGDHHVGCGGNANRIFQHNSLPDAAFSAAQSAALAPRREIPSLIPGS